MDGYTFKMHNPTQGSLLQKNLTETTKKSLSHITFYHLNPFVFHMKSSFHPAKLVAPPSGSKVYNKISLILLVKSNVDINGITS